MCPQAHWRAFEPNEFIILILKIYSRHRHRVEHFLDDCVGRHGLRLGFAGQDNAMVQHVGVDVREHFGQR